MVGQVFVTTNKLLSNPTGSEIELQPFNENIHGVSVSVCKIFESLDLYSDTIPALVSIEYQNSKNVTGNQHEENVIKSSPSFSWVNDKSYLCKTFPLKGKQVKIVHTAYGTNDKNMYIYVHKTGFLGSGLEIKINKDWFSEDNILLLEISELHLIPEEAKCSDEVNLEECREEYISAAVNNITGCVLKFMR